MFVDGTGTVFGRGLVEAALTRSVRPLRAGGAEGRLGRGGVATGVGRPVLDLLRRADLGCAMYLVMITGGTVEHCQGGYEQYGAWRGGRTTTWCWR